MFRSVSRPHRALALTFATLALAPLAHSEDMAAPAAAPTETAAPAPAEAAPADARSYSLGVALAGNVMEGYADMNVDFKVLLQGFAAKVNGEKLPLDELAIQQNVDKFAEEAQAMHDPSKKNKEAGEKFLAANKGKEGVITTASGLQYTVLKEGDGDSPSPTDKVTAHYTGKLLDGTVFDSSVERGTPAEFPLNGVIKGWQEVVPLMKKGGKIKTWIPSELAYGEGGTPGGPIGPNETLEFEIELLKINGK